MNSCVEAPTNVSLWNMQYPTPGMQFYSAHSQKDAAQQQISVKLARTVCAFTSALSSTGTGTLSQIWLPSVCEDGSVVLSTQVFRPKPRIARRVHGTICSVPQALVVLMLLCKRAASGAKC